MLERVLPFRRPRCLSGRMLCEWPRNADVAQCFTRCLVRRQPCGVATGVSVRVLPSARNMSSASNTKKLAEFETPPAYRVNAKAREPLVRWMRHALESAGCTIIHASAPNVAPFRISFQLPSGERRGLVAYAFLANSRSTRNRPADEHRFQVKYGPESDAAHPIWQDPFGLYTTLFLGINPDADLFVAADPVLHSPTKFFISIEFKQDQADKARSTGWHAWERITRSREGGPIEVLVGGSSSSFLRLIEFERDALGEDPGHRQLIAERTPDFANATPRVKRGHGQVLAPSQSRIHQLAKEFEMTEAEVLMLISESPHLKMAVRGSVAEAHLARTARALPHVANAERVLGGGGVDVRVTLKSGKVFGIQCKNVLRARAANGDVRLDFQRTRASKSNSCSRYYSPRDFDVVAACLHAVTERWEFSYVLSGKMDPHPTCTGKLASNVRIDSRWSADLLSILGRPSAGTTRGGA